MTTSQATSLSFRDRAVLRAVAAGRCRVSPDAGVVLLIDGVTCCDQLAGPRLARAGLIATSPGPARLTASGRALLDAVSSHALLDAASGRGLLEAA